MTRHTAAQAQEVTAGRAKIVRLGEVEVGLFRLADGGWRAYRNFCPHAGAPVCEGDVTGGAHPALRCPWHDWQFDLATGAWRMNPRCRLDSFRVEVVDGTVFVWA